CMGTNVTALPLANWVSMSASSAAAVDGSTTVRSTGSTISSCTLDGPTTLPASAACRSRAACAAASTSDGSRITGSRRVPGPWTFMLVYLPLRHLFETSETFAVVEVKGVLLAVTRDK